MTAGMRSLFLLLLGTLPIAGHAQQRPPASAVSVGAQVRKLVEQDWLDQDRVFSAKPLRQPPVSQPEVSGVTTAQDAAGGCDGIKTGRCGFHTASNELDPWWQVDLGRNAMLDRVVVYNRTDGNTAPRTL